MRLYPSRIRYDATSPPPLPPRLVEQHRGRHRDVQRPDRPEHRDGGLPVAALAHEPTDAPPLTPQDERDGAGEVQLVVGRGLSARCGVDPEAVFFHPVDRPPQVRLPRHAHVLARPGARLDGRGRHACGPVLRNHDAARPGPVRRPQDRPQVTRVGDAVENYNERVRGGQDLIQPRVRIRPHARYDALMDPAKGELVDPFAAHLLYRYAGRTGRFRDLSVT